MKDRLQIRVDATDNTWGWLEHPQVSTPVRVRLGRNGVVPMAEGREGDGKTPLGNYPIRRLHYRADRIDLPATQVPCREIAPEDAWCDTPDDPAYNQLVRLPYGASAESLWRADHVYDLILEIGHNDDPVVPGLGSAIFVHLMRDDQRPTAGCVALPRELFLDVLPHLSAGDPVQIE